MASDNLIMWFGVLFIEWFFLARKKGDGDDERNPGIENLGWLFIFLTSAIGIAVIEAGESTLAFVFGGICMIIAMIKFIRNWND